MQKIKNALSKKVATKVFVENNQIIIRYHQTNIVTINKDEIILNHNNFKTVTTKRRMNQVSDLYNLGFFIYQKKYNWFIAYKGQIIDFNKPIVCLKI